MEVSKTNNRNEPIDMQRKVDYTRQAIVKYSSESTMTNSSNAVRIR